MTDAWTPGTVLVQRATQHYDGVSCYFCGHPVFGDVGRKPIPEAEGRLICHRKACYAKMMNEKLRVARARGLAPMPPIPVGGQAFRIPVLGTKRGE